MKDELQHQVPSCVVISQDQIACQMPINKAIDRIIRLQMSIGMNEVVWQKSSAHWWIWFDKIVLEASTIRITLVQCHFGLLFFRSFRSVIPYFSLVFFSVGSRAVFRGRKRSVNRLPSRVPPLRGPSTLIRRSLRDILRSSTGER